MSFDVTTLALAKSYADQHGGGGASTADDGHGKSAKGGYDSGALGGNYQEFKIEADKQEES